LERVLQHQVLAGRAADRALAHLDEAADAVLGVHDVVAGLQGDQVDGVAPARGAACGLGGAGPVAGEVGLGEQPRGRPR
jgi:hypothetical protein